MKDYLKTEYDYVYRFLGKHYFLWLVFCGFAGIGIGNALCDILEFIKGKLQNKH